MIQYSMGERTTRNVCVVSAFSPMTTMKSLFLPFCVWPRFLISFSVVSFRCRNSRSTSRLPVCRPMILMVVFFRMAAPNAFGACVVPVKSSMACDTPHTAPLRLRAVR